MNRIASVLCWFLVLNAWVVVAQNAATPAPSPAQPATALVDSHLVPSVKALDFGNQAVHAASPPQTLNLTNSGNNGVLIKEVTASPKDFGVNQNCRTRKALAAGESCTILVDFTPDGVGPHNGKIRIVVPDATPIEIALTGNGVESSVALSRTHLVFRDQMVNTRGDRQIVHFDNHGTAPLSIKSITVSDNFLVLPTRDQCVSDSPLAPGKTCDLVIGFSPSSEGLLTGALTIEDSDPASPHRILLNARATTVKLSAPSLIWNSTAVGGASTSQDVQISNQGRSTLRIDGIEANGDFVQHNTCGKELASLQSCVISVVFQPKSVGKLSGSLKIRDSDITALQAVFLVGTSVPLELSPANIDFGNQKLESTSPPQTIILTNHGTASIELRSIGVNGDFVMPSKSCGASVAAGKSCKVALSFSPTASGLRSGKLSVDTGAGAPLSVALTGTGIDDPAKKP